MHDWEDRSDEPGLVDAIRLIRTSGATLLDHAGLHVQLALVEWQAERKRLLGLLQVLLVGLAFLICLLLFGGVLVLVTAWDTAFRLHAALGIVLVYGAGFILAWRTFLRRQAPGDAFFAASREELAADIARMRDPS